MTRIFKPRSQFISGTGLRTQVERWEITQGGRVYVYFTDGLIMRSEESISTLRTIAIEVHNG